MSQKDRKKANVKQGSPGGTLRAEVERLIVKGRLKDAVKQAKMCYREEGTPENHRLMEQAYFLRAQQLYSEGMPSSAAEVAQHLLDFGVTDPSLTAGLAPLLMKVGLSGPALAMQDRLESPEGRAKLILTAADQAVLHPERAPASLPEIGQGAKLVREALEALEAGDEAGALDRLRDIPRNSPFADWRYFVRGLAAFRRGEAEQVAANWDRLEAGRSAAKMARSLRAPAAGGPTPTALETQVFGEPILDRLEQLRQYVNAGRWTEMTRILGSLRFSLRRVDVRLAERLTRVLIPSIVDAAERCDSFEEAERLVGSFTRTAEPLPIDPRWNRLWALIWDGPQTAHGASEPYWRKYLADLETLSALTPEERPRAQALVWKHLGKLLISEVVSIEEDGEFYPSTRREMADLKTEAIDCLEQSLRLDPAHLATYQELVEAYEDWKLPEKAEAAARRLLEAFPDHFETLMLLVNHHFRRGEPDRALSYVLRARTLKPLDPTVKNEEWIMRLGLARLRAIEGRWDEGRAEFAQAEQLGVEPGDKYTFLARKAVFELKAGEDGRAEELIKEAQQILVEPTPLWLVLLIEATRYQLPKEAGERFDHLWQVGLAKKGKSETAGALADLLASYVNAGIEYDGRPGHIAEVLAYVKRTSRIRYHRDDLINICTFLSQFPKEEDLLEKLAKRGLKNFPDSVAFLLMASSMEIQKGPYHGNVRQAKQHLEKGLVLAQASGDPKDAQIVPAIKAMLSRLSDLTSSPFGSPFSGFGGMPPLPRALLDMYADMDFDEEDDFDDDEEDDEDRPLFGHFAPPSAPGPKRTKSKSKKKKKK